MAAEFFKGIGSGVSVGLLDLLISAWDTSRFGATDTSTLMNRFGSTGPVFIAGLSIPSAYFNAIFTMFIHSSTDMLKNWLEMISPQGLINFEELIGAGLFPGVIHGGSIELLSMTGQNMGPLQPVREGMYSVAEGMVVNTTYRALQINR